MSVSVVVDTSVAFKWFVQAGEDSVEKAFALLADQAAGLHTLTAPASLPVELANALRYSKHQPDDVLDALENLDLSHVELFEPTSERLHAGGVLAYRHGLSIYDALFLALAEELRCPLVTADRRAFARIDSPIEIRLL